MSNDVEFSQELSLSNVCLGNLDKEFKALYPQLVSSLKDGNKSSVSITVELSKVPDTTTMVKVNYSITPKYPAKKRSGIAQMDNDFKLRTETPPPENIKLFQVNANNA